MSASTAARLGPKALAAVLVALPDGVMVFDVDWTIGYVNPAGAALVGRPVAELTGRSLWIALPEASGTIFHSFLLHARRAGAPVTADLQAIVSQVVYGNLISRASPEWVQRVMQLAMAHAAVVAEQQLLTQIGSLSKAVTGAAIVDATSAPDNDDEPPIRSGS